MNRRNLLKIAAIIATTSALEQTPLCAAVSYDALEARLAKDPRRPQFHLLPKRNWMNDPNGPIYWKGQYHMFFQYNPHAAVWGDMHWGHAVSPDMVHWKHLPVALAPTPGGPDAAGCFSGTAVVDGGVVAILYTGVRAAAQPHTTVNDGQHLFREGQCLATSTDPELKVWKKRAQPVIAEPPAGMHVTGFRDPSPWRMGEWWYLAVGSGIAHQGGKVLLYRSRDLQHWDYLHVLVSGQGAGEKAANPVANGDMWECPDFFPLAEKHALIYSSEGKVHWQIGVLDEAAMLFHPERTGVVDHGNYYAAKSQRDAEGRRILWGWVTEARRVARYKAAGWAGLMSLPRVLTLRSDGGLGMEVASEIKKLRGKKQILTQAKDALMQLSHLHISRATGEIMTTLKREDKPWTLHVRGTLPQGAMEKPMTTVAYDPARPKRLRVNGAPIDIPGAADQPLELHAFVDGSVTEMIVQQAASYTQRFYYSASQAPDVHVEFEGPRDNLQALSMWEIEPISSDRLTS